MSSVAAISVELNLDDSGFSSKMRTAAGATRTLTLNLRAAQAATSSAEHSVHSMTASLAEFTIAFLTVEKAVEALKYALLELPEEIVNVNAEMQRLRTQFQGLSTQFTEAGRKGDATKWLTDLLDLSEKTPFSLKEMGNSFVMMKSVGIDPMNGSLKALTDALSQFGGTDEQLNHATLAIMEMAGRGVVSLEQLRRQLGKAIPTAIRDMAFAMNMSYGELMAAVQKGTLESTTALAKMLEEMKIVYAGQGLLHMQNFIGQMQVFDTEWQKLAMTVGDAGFMDAVQAQFQKIIDLMQSPAAQTFAQSYGRALGELVNDLAVVAQKIIEFHNEIIHVGEALIAVFASAALRGAIRSLVGNIGAVSAAIRGELVAASRTYYSAASMALNVTQFWNAGGLQLASTLGRMAAAARLFGGALLNVIPVAGQIIFVLYSLAQAMGLFENKTEDAVKDINNGIITERAVNLVRQRAAEIKREIAALRATGADTVLNPATGKMEQIKGLNDAKIKQLQAELARLGEVLDKGNKELLDRAATTLKNAVDKDISDASMGLVETYKKTRMKLETELAQPGLSDSARQEINQQRIANERTYYTQLIALLSSYEKQTEDASKNADGAAKVAARKLTTELQDQIHRLREAAANADEIFNAPNKVITKPAKGLTAIEIEIDHYKEILASTQARMHGFVGEYAKMDAAVASGRFKNATKEQTDELLKLARQLDDSKAKLKAYQHTQQTNSTVLGEIGSKYQQSADKLKEVQAELARGDMNPETMGLLTFEANLDRLRNKLSVTPQQLAEVNRQIIAAANNMKQVMLDDKILKLQEKARQINDSLADNTRQAKEDAFNTEMAQLQDLVDKTTSTAEQRKMAEDALQTYILARRRQVNRETENGLQKMSRQWADVTEQMSQATGKWVNDGMAEIDNFVQTGKFDFAKLTEEIIADLIKIRLEASLSPLLKYAGDALGNLLGPGGGTGQISASQPAGMSTADASGFFAINHAGRGPYETAKTMRKLSAALFANAPRFHSGRLPGLRAGELPAVIRDDESVLTPEQLAAVSGNRQPMDIQFNLINQSGMPLEAQKGSSHFDGKQMILDVVLRAASTPGSFRDGMKGALAR